MGWSMPKGDRLKLTQARDIISRTLDRYPVTG